MRQHIYKQRRRHYYKRIQHYARQDRNCNAKHPLDLLWTRDTDINSGPQPRSCWIYRFDLAPTIDENTPFINVTAAEGEDYLMNIVGTAFQVGDNKLVTCEHVVNELLQVEEKRPHYILGRIFRGNTVLTIPYSIKSQYGS